MHLNQILNAAVAAVNVGEMQQLPSPDVPQNSPTAPAPSQDDGLLNLKMESSLSFSSTELNSQTRTNEDIQRKHDSQGHLPNDNNDLHLFNEELQSSDAQTTSLGDMSFFALDDDNLVITSQQALEMFESKPEEVVEDYAPTYHVLTTSENPPQVNTPPLEVKGETPVQDVPQIQEMFQTEQPIPIQAATANQEEIYIDSEVPVAGSEVDIPGDVPVPFEEVEVLTTEETPQYTALTPASAPSSSLPVFDNTLQDLSPDVLQTLPGTTLDATVDANGRFVVQVVAPGMNLNIPNYYIGNEEVVESEPIELQQVPPSGLPQTQGEQLSSTHVPTRTGPYTSFAEYHPSPYTPNTIHNQARHASCEQSTRSSSPDNTRATNNNNNNNNSSLHPPKKRSDVLIALRDSIFRSQAKKRSREDHEEIKPSKKRSAYQRQTQELIDRQTHVLHDVRPDPRPYIPDHGTKPFERFQNNKNYVPNCSNYQRNSYNESSNLTRRPLDHRPNTGSRSPGGGMMVLRPEELSAALQQRGPGSGSPLVVMRPEDLHAGGGGGGENEDPLQVQLVYLVYPMDENGNQNTRMPTESVQYGLQGFTQNMLELPKPQLSASRKQLPWLHSRQEERVDEFLRKPISKWKYDPDVVDFIFAAWDDLKCTSAPDINFAVLSTMNGEDLLKLDQEGFKGISKMYGEQMYRYFCELKEKSEPVVPSQDHHHTTHHLPMQPLYECFENSTNSVIQSSHIQQDVLTDSSAKHETQAPYEFRYQLLEPPRGLAFGENNRNQMISATSPTSASKIFEPFHAPTPSSHYSSTMESLSDPDQSCNDEEPKPEPPKKRGPGRPRKPENELKRKKKTGRLWEFIRNLLLDPETCPSLVKWENAEEGIFRFVQAEKVAQRWGDRKKNKEMNYEKLSRAMRYYYKGGVFEAVLGRRLVYKFGKNAKNWKPSNPNFQNPV